MRRLSKVLRKSGSMWTLPSSWQSIFYEKKRTAWTTMVYAAVVFLAWGHNGSAETLREVVAIQDQNGREIVLYSDGFWHYHDSAGEVCTEVHISGNVCALGSEWAPLPDPKKKQRPTFVSLSGDRLSDGVYLGEMDSIGSPGQRMHNDLQDVGKFLIWRIEQHSGTALPGLSFEAHKVSSQSWFKAEFIGGRGPEIISFLEHGNMIIIGVTVDLDTSFITNAHRQKHVEFLQALRF